MTEQVTAHKTSDGKLFEDEAQAEAHESRMIAMRVLVPLLNSCPLTLSSFDVSDLVEYMVDHREAFVRALMGQDDGDAEDPDPDDDRDTLDTSTLDPEEPPPVDEKATFPNVPRPDDDDVPF